MSDSTKQANGEAEAYSASALGERLIRRGTEPLGVIDVRYAEEKYFRIVRLLARISELLDLLRLRYGVEEQPTGAEHPFAIQRLPGQQVSILSPAIQSLSPTSGLQTVTSDAPQHPPLEDWRPSSLAQIIAERSLAPVSERQPSPEGEFRISRRRPSMLRKSDAASQGSRPIESLSTPKQPSSGATLEGDSSAHQRPPAFEFRNSGVDGTVDQADVTTGTSAQEKLPSARLTNEDDSTASSGTASSIGQPEVFGSSITQERQAGTPVRNERADTAASFLQREPASNSNPQERRAGTSVKNVQAGTASTIEQREVFRGSITQERHSGTPLRKEEADTAASFVQREPASNSNPQELRAGTSVKNVQAGTASTIEQREVFRGSITQERPLATPVRNERADTASSFVQGEAARNRNAQEPRASARDQVNPASPILQRELARNPNAKESPAAAVVRNDQAGTASSIAERENGESANALPVSPLALIRPLAEPPGDGTLLPAESTVAATPPEYGDVRGQQNVRGPQTSRFVPGEIAAPEIRRDSINTGPSQPSPVQERPHIVWREPQAGTRAADSTAPGSRSVSGSSREPQPGAADVFSATQQSGQGGVAARTQDHDQEIQLEHISPRVIRSISEQVIRAITLDLKLERERRGVTKWR